MLSWGNYRVARVDTMYATSLEDDPLDSPHQEHCVDSPHAHTLILWINLNDNEPHIAVHTIENPETNEWNVHQEATDELNSGLRLQFAQHTLAKAGIEMRIEGAPTNNNPKHEGTGMYL